MATTYKRQGDKRRKGSRWRVRWFDAERGKWRDAIRDYSESLHDHSGYLPALIGRAAAKMQIGDLDGAIADFGLRRITSVKSAIAPSRSPICIFAAARPISAGR